VAGLTLGGGFGWLSRKYGMSVDNLLSAEVVTADGRQLHASETENADLFWGLRGGGGNFGIVTRFEFRLHPVGPEVLSGLIVFPFGQSKAVLTQFARFTETMPDALNVWAVARKAPSLPFLPEEVHGKAIVALALCYAGDPAEGEKLIEPLRGFGKAHSEHIGGQTTRVAPEAMAYASRDTRYVMNVHGRWEPAAEDERCIGWARKFFARTRPFASDGAYVNFLTQDESDRIAFAYGVAYGRLVELKKKYDPVNFHRMNQNIKPV
jgi:FAD/FMN-containing dehydrogenase